MDLLKRFWADVVVLFNTVRERAIQNKRIHRADWE